MSKEKTTYRLREKAGSHVHSEDGETVKLEPGDTIESAYDLIRMFPQKFDKVESLPVNAPSVTPKQPAPKKATQPRKQPPRRGTSPTAGKDVTEKFPKAVEEDFKVFSKNGYWVTEADNTADILNQKKLKKAEVEPFIDQYLQS